MSGIWNIRTFMRPRAPRPFRYVTRYAEREDKGGRLNLQEGDFLSLHPIAGRLKGQVSTSQRRRMKMPAVGWGVLVAAALGWLWTEGWLPIGWAGGAAVLLLIWLWLRKMQRSRK